MRIGALTYAHGIAYFNNNTREIFDDKRVSDEIEQERIIKKLEEDRKKVQPIYDAEGQIIEYDQHGKHLDVKN